MSDRRFSLIGAEWIALWSVLLGLALALAIFLSLSCATPEPLETPRQGTSVDPCGACWADCSHKTSQPDSSQIEAIFCSQTCNELCNVLHQDGGS